MAKAYIVYQQEYEEVYVYGVFLSEESLESALNLLAAKDDNFERAKKQKDEQINWYESRHKPWAESKGVEPTKPFSMTVPLFEYSKSLFDVHEIEADKVILYPNIIWFDDD